MTIERFEYLIARIVPLLTILGKIESIVSRKFEAHSTIRRQFPLQNLANEILTIRFHFVKFPLAWSLQKAHPQREIRASSASIARRLSKYILDKNSLVGSIDSIRKMP